MISRMRTRKIAEKIKRNAGNKRHHSVTADNLVTCNNTKIIIKQNRTEQNRTERNGTEQKRREENRTEVKRRERNGTKRNATEQNRPGYVTHRMERRTFPRPLRLGRVQCVLQLWHWPVARKFGNLRPFVTKS